MCGFWIFFEQCIRTVEIYVLSLSDHAGVDEEGEGTVPQSRFPWEGSDRDYEYEEVNYLLELPFEVQIILSYIFWLLYAVNVSFILFVNFIDASMI